MSNDCRSAFLATSLVFLTGFASLTGLLLGVAGPSSAQVTYQIERNPTDCNLIGGVMTSCESALSSDNTYASSSGWFYSDWPYRKKITINSTRVAADLSNFPVLIKITDSDLQEHSQNGDDILFTHADGITKLSHEIESFNRTTGEVIAWVNVTDLSSTLHTDIYMHYGRESIGIEEDVTGVWDSGYVGVYHLGEIPDGTADDVRDSTQYSNHGTSSGMTDVDQVAGQIDGSLSLGVADSVVIADNASLEFEQGGSVAAWFNSDVALNFIPGGDTPRYRALVERANSFLLYYDSANGGFEMLVRQTGGWAYYHTRLDGSDPQSVPAGEWHHVAFTFNRTHGWAYYDGAFRGDADTPLSGQDFSDGGAMILGAATLKWEGKLDEVRVSVIASESARSGAWIATGYNNQNDPSTFYNVGVEERQTSDAAWKNFGFRLNASDAIDQVEIGVEWFRDNAAPTLDVAISWDGGSTWGPTETATNKSTDDNTLQFLDFTSAVAWTPSGLNDANLRARASANASGAHLDHLVVRVTFTPTSLPGPELAPMVVTLKATNITRDTANLWGSLEDPGSATEVQVSFEWGLSPALGEETAPERLQTPATFQVSLEALSAGTTFYYRSRAVGNGTAVGETMTFETVPPAFVLDGLQLSFYMTSALVVILLAYFLTRKHIGGVRAGRIHRSSQPGTGGGHAPLGGLLAKLGSFPRRAGRGLGEGPAAGLGTPSSAPTTAKVKCPRCGSLLEGEPVYCFGCGQALYEPTMQTEEVAHAKGALEVNEGNKEAQVTVGAHSAADDTDQEAIEILDRLEVAAGEAASVRAAGEARGGLGSCLYCGTALEPETGNCPACSRSGLGQYEALEEQVTRVLAALELDESDTEALFALGTYLLIVGKAREALDTLNRLTLLDPDYPGLWRAKAVVFEKLGNKNAAESALVQAQRRNTALGGNAE